MKKNFMMRAASALLVAVLLSTCTISGTFAKYTTSVSSHDSARVAYWGFVPSAMDLTNLFDNVYNEGGEDTVKAAVDVIAPGTTGSASFAFAYDNTKGKPEVKYSFNVSTGGSSCAANIQANTNIQWRLITNGVEGAWGTWAQLIDAIEAMDGDQDYLPGTLPANFNDLSDVHTVEWRWLFDGTVPGASDLDTTDTQMGYDLGEVILKITITATQID